MYIIRSLCMMVILCINIYIYIYNIESNIYFINTINIIHYTSLYINIQYNNETYLKKNILLTLHKLIYIILL